MKKFEFSKSESTPSINFYGHSFYFAFKNAEFLGHYEHIEAILFKGYELRKKLKDLAPGETLKMNGIWLDKKTPMIVRKTGPNVTVKNYEFTANRLTGLVAAYAFDNRHKFPIMKSSEAITLRLEWDNNNTEKCRLYLSAVSGSEHFYDQFLYLPLVCALRKLQLKKITLEPVVKMAKIKNKDGIAMGRELIRNIVTVTVLWQQFPDTNFQEMKTFFEKLPIELKKLLKEE